MTSNSLLKKLLRINGAVVENAEFGENAKGGPSLVVHVHVSKGHRWRCPVCGEKCHVHDYACDEAFWRGMDFGPVEVRIGARGPRVRRPVDGVVTAAVPWAKPGSRFTTDFAFSAAWMVKGGLSRKKVSEHPRIDWETVGRLVDLVWHELEPDVKRRFDGLVRIGVDETSYRKGHCYIAIVVNHDTNTVVWAQRCRIPAFVELGRKIRRHGEHILNTVRNGLSNARIEATNNKIKLLLRVAYGFRNIDTMIGLVKLLCSSIEIPWPGRKPKEPINKGSGTHQAA